MFIPALLAIVGTAVHPPVVHEAQPEPRHPDAEIVYYDGLDDEGRLVGGYTWLVIPPYDGSVIEAPVFSDIAAGNPANRLDLVFVGDGYTEGEMGLFHQHVDLQLQGFLAKEPYARYSPLFNFHRVEVVSNESGVDNDPERGIQRDTALDMGFWCNNTERLLCVNVTRARQYANNAPGVDLIAAFANSTKYGGAGYPNQNLGTASGGNNAAVEILLHEFGHALGNLADEYTYGGPEYYQGNEPGRANVSIYPHDEMMNRQTKWFRWLGVNNPQFDGLTSTFEGGNYSQFGIYRPSNNSLMRSLNRPFNLPSLEAMVIEIYRIVDPVDNASPADGIYTVGDTLHVDPVEPINAPLDIEWRVDGNLVHPDNPRRVAVADLGLAPGSYTLAVRVVDNTPWVRNEAMRAAHMTFTRSYDVQIDDACPADLNGDGRVDGDDFLVFLQLYFAADERVDFNNDGRVDGADFLVFLHLYFEGCDG